jgi:hypothetical protein
MNEDYKDLNAMLTQTHQQIEEYAGIAYSERHVPVHFSANRHDIQIVRTNNLARHL